MPPKCPKCQTYHSQKKPCPADPAQSAYGQEISEESLALGKTVARIEAETLRAAQSAPSAEPLDPEKFLYERLGFTFKAINSSLTVTIFRPEFKIFSFSQYDGKWDVVYLMDDAWKLLVELAAEKQAAALRTAQLEREKSEQYEQWFKEVATLNDRERISQAKLETAESAMRDAREKTIQECAKTLDGLARPMKKQLKKGRT